MTPADPRTPDPEHPHPGRKSPEHVADGRPSAEDAFTDGPGGRVFRRAHEVRFADVDAAGIVYYPRLLHYCHLTFEEFFPHAGDRSYASWIQEGRIGFPTVHLDVDFARPVEYGRPLTMTARVLRIGGRSVTFRFTGEREDGSTAFRADVTKVCASMDDGRSRDLTPELRTLFASHLIEGNTVEGNTVEETAEETPATGDSA